MFNKQNYRQQNERIQGVGPMALLQRTLHSAYIALTEQKQEHEPILAIVVRKRRTQSSKAKEGWFHGGLVLVESSQNHLKATEFQQPGEQAVAPGRARTSCGSAPYPPGFLINQQGYRISVLNCSN
jgi:hypothetical protein